MRSCNVTEVPANAQLIDVRESDEWAGGHAAGAVHMPMSDFMSYVGNIDQDREVYVICAAGGRSAQVCEYLAQNGIDAINVDGGTNAWISQGLPTENP